MSKRLVILLVFVLVTASLILILNSKRQLLAPNVAIGFLGFTNSAGLDEALFGITNCPYAPMSLLSVRLKEASGSSSANKERGHSSWVRGDPWGLLYAINVETTNEPLRVVFRFQRPSVGPRRLIERVIGIVGKLTGNERTYFTGDLFYVTNETTVTTVPR